MLNSDLMVVWLATTGRRSDVIESHVVLREERASNRKTSLQCNCIGNKEEKKLNDILNGVQRDFKDPQDMKKGNSGRYLEDIQ